MATKQPEREQTDVSLRSERAKTDAELEKKRSVIEEDSDAVLALARERADEVLRAARARADTAGAGSTAAVRVERTAADRALAEERSTETAQLSGEREARQRALAELLGYERDETDRDLLVERSRTDTALMTRDDFLAMVSHDLRNMLGGVAVTTAMLVKEAAPDEQGRKVVRRAETIQRFTARMNRLIGDLLDVVSIDAGHLAVEPSLHEVSRLLSDSAEAFQPAAAAQHVTLSVAEAPGLPRARFDYERILQVLANLLSNALKFTGPGGRIELRAAREGQQVRISVSDSGTGIPESHLETVFERFRQVDRSDRRGHGLGLHISRSIVEKHGGRIWAQSTPGQGSTFHFTLPCEDSAAGPPA